MGPLGTGTPACLHRWGSPRRGRKRDREHRDKGPKDRPILWTPKLADARHVRRFAPTRRQATRYAGQRPSSSLEKDEIEPNIDEPTRLLSARSRPRDELADRLISNETRTETWFPMDSEIRLSFTIFCFRVCLYKRLYKRVR